MLLVAMVQLTMLAELEVFRTFARFNFAADLARQHGPLHFRLTRFSHLDVFTPQFNAVEASNILTSHTILG
jgi:hypothetical protein